VSEAEAYEQVPYPGLAIPQTHPDRLAVLGVLHGLTPAPPDRARVLEVGCADGLNLVAMAAHVPGLEAVGFDLVDPAIGREAAADLGLANVRLERADLRDARAWGEFDYVIAHGVYAWVPDDAREGLMALLARTLAPHGIAFVSYNALPGARLRTMLREIALLHAGPADGMQARVDRSRELFGFLAPWAEDRPDAYGQVLATELARLRGLSTAVLAHDDLGERYEPVWLRDVVRHADAHGLRYLGDAEHSELYADRRPPGVDEQLDAIAGGDRVVWEQYGDILAGRQFRQTLLCRGDVPVDDAIEPGRLASLWFCATDDTEPGGNGSAGPGALALLLARRPQVLSCPELRALLRTDDVDGLCRELWHGVRHGYVGLRAAPSRAAVAPGERPEASAFARRQAARGPELTSLRHDAVRLDDPFGRHLVGLCDGARDRPALLDGLVAAVGREVTITTGGEPVADGELLRPQIAAGLEHNLALLARLGLLIR
jgi:SAM-dependent methyltransferase